MYFKINVPCIEDRLWECRLEVLHFRHEQKIFGHPKFLSQLKKIIKFWGIRHLKFKKFLGSSPPPPPAKCNPLSDTLATCLDLLSSIDKYLEQCGGLFCLFVLFVKPQQALWPTYRVPKRLQ